MVRTQRPHQEWTFFLPGYPIFAAVPGAATCSDITMCYNQRLLMLPTRSLHRDDVLGGLNGHSRARAREAIKDGVDRRRLILPTFYGALGGSRTATLRRAWKQSISQSVWQSVVLQRSVRVPGDLSHHNFKSGIGACCWARRPRPHLIEAFVRLPRCG